MQRVKNALKECNMEENLSKINEIIGSMELSPSEVGTILWLSEQDPERVDDLCRIMEGLRYLKSPGV